MGGGSDIGFDNEFRKYFPIRQVVPVGIRNSESTDVGDGFHKRKKLYVTGYHTCIYNSALFMYWGRLEWVDGSE